MNSNVLEILHATKYCSVATVTPQGLPWNVPISFAFDEEFLYFRSSPDALHSKNIAANPEVSVTVLDTSQTAKGALYIQSKVSKLDGDEKQKAINVFNERFNNPPSFWEETHFFKLPIGNLDTQKTIDRMYYFREHTV